jgi:hypothetical protein
MFMSTGPLRTETPTLDIYIKLAPYPILADKIRERMRAELFMRGIISEEKFEAEVKEKAKESQKREGAYNPFDREPATVWRRRRERVRNHQTDFYFGHSLTIQLFEEIVKEVLNEAHAGNAGHKMTQMSFNPELAPWWMLLQQGEQYEKLPPPQQLKYHHHLEEIKVVLIKGMISDQLRFVGIAKRIFTIADLRWIYERRIGGGKIGGKAAGMLLAWRILEQKNPEFGGDISESIGIPDSYFLGTNVIYDFRQLNGLDEFMNQKYLPLEQIRDDYSKICRKHLAGVFPEDIKEELRSLVIEKAGQPMIVRSSSLLEDNFGYAFAGKYDSYFCPNQGTTEENLENLLNNIKRVFASVVNPDALLYRKERGLIDYDERMAILIQLVHGQQHGKYFFPTLAGVGFSENPFRWNAKIRREDGFLRMVLGMGTRAVNRVDQDYPRLIALSNPELRPETTASAIRTYSQHYIDVIDLEDNTLKTLPLSEVIDENFPYLRFVGSIEKDGFLQPMLSVGSLESVDDVVLTFDYLTKDKKFTRLFRTALMRIEQHYGTPVDTEFAIDIIPNYPYPDYKLHLLQCRPLSQHNNGPVQIPSDIPDEDLLFQSSHLVPHGEVEGIRYIIFVDPEAYYRIKEVSIRYELGRAVSRLNHILTGQSFIIMGPGRWGSSNIELGVKVGYSDIHNTKVLIEMAVATGEGATVPELSYGTHFFQDLVERGIYSLPLHLAGDDGSLDWTFFRDTPNVLEYLSPQDAPLDPYLRVIDVAQLGGNRRLNILMDGDGDKAVGYLADGDWKMTEVTGSLSSF